MAEDVIHCPMRKVPGNDCQGVLQPKPAPPAPRFVCSGCRRVYSVKEAAWIKGQRDRLRLKLAADRRAIKGGK